MLALARRRGNLAAVRAWRERLGRAQALALAPPARRPPAACALAVDEGLAARPIGSADPALTRAKNSGRERAPN